MKGVIFDFNGTMIFDEKFHVASWRQFLEEKIGRTILDEEFQKHIHGVNADVTLKYFISDKLGREEIAELTEEKEKIYRKLCLESGEYKLVDGLEKFLDALKKNKIPTTIATASGWGNLNFFFDNLNLAKWFNIDYVVYDDGTLPGKPAPDMYLKAAEVIGVNNSDCVIFEDSRSGIKAAKSSGAGKVVGLSSMLDEEILLKAGADEVIPDYKNFDFLMSLVTEK